MRACGPFDAQRIIKLDLDFGFCSGVEISMNQKIDENVEVDLISQSPKSVLWRGRKYEIIKIGLHHKYREGTTLYHIFSVITPTLFLRLNLNTDNLLWTLEEISDGI